MRFLHLVVTMAGVAALALAQKQAAQEARTRVFRNSLSLSPFTELLFTNGVQFTDGKVTAKNPEELQQLFMKYGANEVYARIATTRTYRKGFGDHSMTRGLERARLAKKLDLPFNPELGLFNIYGDVRCQPPPDFSDYPQISVPGVWTSLTLDQMLPVLRSYGAIAAREIIDTGVKVRIWDLGNEVEFGTAGVSLPPFPGGCDDTEGANWYKPPDKVDPEIGKQTIIGLIQMPEAQRISWLQTHLWPHTAKIFAAVAEGIRSVDPQARFTTHTSGMVSVMPSFAVAFYKALKEGGFYPDELGFSFYPSSSAMPPNRLEAFKSMVTAVNTELKRRVFITEFGYPAAKMTEGAFADWNHVQGNYNLTPEGQADFIRDLVRWGANAGVSGIRPWAPDLPVPGWEPMSFFSAQGTTATGRPALSAIQDGLRRRLP